MQADYLTFIFATRLYCTGWEHRTLLEWTHKVHAGKHTAMILTQMYISYESTLTDST